MANISVYPEDLLNHLDIYSKNVGTPERSPALARERTKSDDPSLRASHPDAKKLRIARAETSGEYAKHVAGSAPAELERHGPGAFATSEELLTGHKSGEPRDGHEKSVHDGR